MSKHGFVTFCDNNNYAKGALVLARSLRHVGTSADLVCLITNKVGDEMRSQLDIAFDKLVTVDIIDSKDAANLALLKRPELGVTLTKLHVWKLTQYEKMVFCDADMVVVRPIDDLFKRPELSAVPDCGWPSCFNTGLFVFCPSLDTYAKLLAHAESFGSFDGGDQGLFNAYFSDWSTADINRILPFGYNVHAAATYTYAPAYKHYANEVRVVHFLGATKPWSSRHAPAASSFGHFWSVWWQFYTEQYTTEDCFAPVFAPSNCAEQAAAHQHQQQQQPEWVHQDTVEAAEKRWLENVPDYMNKDNSEKIEAHIDNEINKDAFY